MPAAVRHCLLRTGSLASRSLQPNGPADRKRTAIQNEACSLETKEYGNFHGWGWGGCVAEQDLEFCSSRIVPDGLALFRQGSCLSPFCLLEPKDRRQRDQRCPGRNRASTRQGPNSATFSRLCHLPSGSRAPLPHYMLILAISSPFLGVTEAGYVPHKFMIWIRADPSCPLLEDQFLPSNILKMER